MKNEIKKLITSIAVFGLIIGLLVPSTINGDELEPVVDEVEEKEIEETVVKDEVTEETKEPVVQATSEVATTSEIITLTSGVLSLDAGTTTFEVAFPDEVFRTYVAQTVLGDSSYVDSTNRSDVLDAGDVAIIESTTVIDVSSMGVESLEGLQHFTSLNELYCFENPIYELTLTDAVKNQITDLDYRHTNITSLDLTGYNALEYLSATKYTNADLSNVTELLVSGSNMYGDASPFIFISGDAGIFSWDSASGYCVVKPSMNGSYFFYMPRNEVTGSAESEIISLSNGGLIDQEGNLIKRANLTNVEDDGSITLSAGDIVTPEGSYYFWGSLEIKDGVITTSNTFSIRKNSIEYNEGTNRYVIDVDATRTIVASGGEGSTIDILRRTATLSKGSIITTSETNVIFIVDEAVIDTDENVTSSGITITVPGDYFFEIESDEEGKHTIPKGSTVTIANESAVYPGTIIYDEVANTITYLPIDTLLNEDETDLADGIARSDVDNAQDIVDGTGSGTLKTQLQQKVDKARDILEAKEAVENLFTDSSHTNIKDTTNQTAIDDAQMFVDQLEATTLKTYLQKEIDRAQTMLNARQAVDDLFKDEEHTAITDDLTQEDINRAQDLVDVLEDGKLKDYLQEEIDKAQAMLDAKGDTPITPSIPAIPNPSIPSSPTTPSTPSKAPSVQGSNVAGSTTTASSVATSDNTNTTLLMGMLVGSIAIFGLLTKKKREVTK